MSLTLRPGVTGLLGANGAGKSTLIRILAGVISPTSGTVEHEPPTEGRAGAGSTDALGYLPQDGAVIKGFTPREFVAYVAWLRRMPDALVPDACSRALGAVGMSERADDKIRSLSGGMRQRVRLAASVVNDPSLLLLDEPTNGLDLEERHRFCEFITSRDRGGITVISSHLTEDLVPVCDQVIVLRDGEVAFDGTFSDLCREFGPTEAVSVRSVNLAYLNLVKQAA